MTTGSPPRSRRRQAWRATYWLLFAVTLIWLWIRREDLVVAVDSPRLIPYGWAFAASTVLWLGGLSVVALSVGGHVGRLVGWHPITTLRTLRSLTATGSTGDQALRRALRGRPFWIGWFASWAGNSGASAVPGFAAFAALGTGGWSIAVLSAVNVMSTFMWRVPANRRLRAMHAEASSVPCDHRPDAAGAGAEGA
ncbi:MAG: hypothetical protein U0Q22_02650 [Acidimicrobiales bacterium]